MLRQFQVCDTRVLHARNAQPGLQPASCNLYSTPLMWDCSLIISQKILVTILLPRCAWSILQSVRRNSFHAELQLDCLINLVFGIMLMPLLSTHPNKTACFPEGITVHSTVTFIYLHSAHIFRTYMVSQPMLDHVGWP